MKIFVTKEFSQELVLNTSFTCSYLAYLLVEGPSQSSSEPENFLFVARFWPSRSEYELAGAGVSTGLGFNSQLMLFSKNSLSPGGMCITFSTSKCLGMTVLST